MAEESGASSLDRVTTIPVCGNWGCVDVASKRFSRLQHRLEQVGQLQAIDESKAVTSKVHPSFPILQDGWGIFCFHRLLQEKICSSRASSLRGHLCLLGEMLGQNEKTA